MNSSRKKIKANYASISAVLLHQSDTVILASRVLTSMLCSNKKSVDPSITFSVPLRSHHDHMAPIRVEDTELSPGPLIVGGGPVGMLTALRLAQLGVPSTLCEMNTDTTRWPKMDNSSCHTMEIFRLMGLVEEYRLQPGAVPQCTDWDTIFFTTCGPKGKLISRWVRWLA